jgi:4-amino-4-deoxy-L-arabinose transferase-like glycosyltransferase
MIVTVTAARLACRGAPADLTRTGAILVLGADPGARLLLKPPLIAWIIGLTTAAFGDSEFAIRVSAPLLHAAVAGLST